MRRLECASVPEVKLGKVEEIEAAVVQLSKEELEIFRTWFEDFQERLWDEQIERDAKSGRLDKLAADALAEHKAGRSRKL
jgi:hypothetical protein